MPWSYCCVLTADFSTLWQSQQRPEPTQSSGGRCRVATFGVAMPEAPQWAQPSPQHWPGANDKPWGRRREPRMKVQREEPRKLPTGPCLPRSDSHTGKKCWALKNYVKSKHWPGTTEKHKDGLEKSSDFMKTRKNLESLDLSKQKRVSQKRWREIRGTSTVVRLRAGGWFSRGLLGKARTIFHINKWGNWGKHAQSHGASGSQAHRQDCQVPSLWAFPLHNRWRILSSALSQGNTQTRPWSLLMGPSFSGSQMMQDRHL